MELSAVKARSKGILLVSRLVPGLATALIGDAARLRQVLINLLGNAVKFTESGEVVLAVQNHESGKSGEIEFSVSDTGIGIPPEKLETIFNDFVQADTSHNTKVWRHWPWARNYSPANCRGYGWTPHGYQFHGQGKYVPL